MGIKIIMVAMGTKISMLAEMIGMVAKAKVLFLEKEDSHGTMGRDLTTHNGMVGGMEIISKKVGRAEEPLSWLMHPPLPNRGAKVCTRSPGAHLAE